MIQIESEVLCCNVHELIHSIKKKTASAMEEVHYCTYL